jgi:hypothetical protein
VSEKFFVVEVQHSEFFCSFGALYGAATMNNTMCLGIFLALVFFKGIVWEFSAEVLSILFVTVVVGTIGNSLHFIQLEWTHYM